MSEQETTQTTQTAQAATPSIQELISALEAARAEARQAQLDATRSRVASRHSLPDSLANRLRGNNEEELDADARLLRQSLPSPAFSAANPAAGPALNLDDIRQMRPEEINRRWPEIRQALRDKA
jgi:ribosomal protein L29